MMKLNKARYIPAAVLSLFVALMLNSCYISYKLNGSAIDYTVYKTI